MVTTTTHSIDLAGREVTGKKVNRLRRQGIVPVHLYGGGKEPLSLQGEGQVLAKLLPEVGTNVPVAVSATGEDGETICFVREVQRHPVTESLLHVDFMRVDAAQTLRADVPIILDGNAPAVRDGGTLVQQMTTLAVEALPLEMPASIVVDISGLVEFEMGIYVSDLVVGPNVELLVEPGEMVCRVLPPRKLEEFELIEEAAEVEGLEGEEGEGEEGDTAETTTDDSVGRE